MQNQYNNLWKKLKSEYPSRNDSAIEFHALLLSLARSISKNKEEAEDLTQDILLMFLTSQSTTEIYNLSQYVYRSLKNHSINLSKSNERRISREQQYQSLQSLHNDDFDSKEQFSELLVSLKDKLKDNEYVLLEKLYDTSIETIAEEAKVSVKTIKNRKSLLFKKIRKTAVSGLFLLVIQVFNSM